MKTKNILLKVISSIVLFQGVLQGIALFIVVANYSAIKNQNMVIYTAGCVFSAIYVLAAFRGGFSGLRNKEKVRNYPHAIVRSGQIMLLANLMVLGLNAVGGLFTINQLSAMIIPVFFVGIAMWQKE
ncbi:MAG: hypothetical protein ACOX1S_11170 [Anaerostipes sp.]|jgi:hypothetical protein